MLSHERRLDDRRLLALKRAMGAVVRGTRRRAWHKFAARAAAAAASATTRHKPPPGAESSLAAALMVALRLDDRAPTSSSGPAAGAPSWLAHASGLTESELVAEDRRRELASLRSQLASRNGADAAAVDAAAELRLQLQRSERTAASAERAAASAVAALRASQAELDVERGNSAASAERAAASAMASLRATQAELETERARTAGALEQVAAARTLRSSARSAVSERDAAAERRRAAMEAELEAHRAELAAAGVGAKRLRAERAAAVKAADELEQQLREASETVTKHASAAAVAEVDAQRGVAKAVASLRKVQRERDGQRVRVATLEAVTDVIKSHAMELEERLAVEATERAALEERTAAAAKARGRSVITLLRRRLRHRDAARAWEQWTRRAAKLRARRHAVDQADRLQDRLEAQRLGIALRRWSTRARAKRRTRKQLRSTVTRMLQQRLASAWKKWAATVLLAAAEAELVALRQRSFEKMTQRVLRTMRASHCARGWRAWTRHAASRVARRAFLRSALEWKWRWRTRRVYAAWRAATVRAQHARRILHRGIQRARHAGLWRAWSCLRETARSASVGGGSSGRGIRSVEQHLHALERITARAQKRGLFSILRERSRTYDAGIQDRLRLEMRRMEIAHRSEASAAKMRSVLSSAIGRKRTKNASLAAAWRSLRVFCDVARAAERVERHYARAARMAERCARRERDAALHAWARHTLLQKLARFVQHAEEGKDAARAARNIAEMREAELRASVARAAEFSEASHKKSRALRAKIAASFAGSVAASMLRRCFGAWLARLLFVKSERLVVSTQRIDYLETQTRTQRERVVSRLLKSDRRVSCGNVLVAWSSFVRKRKSSRERARRCFDHMERHYGCHAKLRRAWGMLLTGTVRVQLQRGAILEKAFAATMDTTRRESNAATLLATRELGVLKELKQASDRHADEAHLKAATLLTKIETLERNAASLGEGE